MDNSTVKSGVYCIRNTVNGKVYVGSAVNLRKRKNEHFSTLVAGTHFNRFLLSAYRKYGHSAFEFVILELVPDKSNLTTVEQRFMDELRAHSEDFGYNLRPKAASNLGMKMSAETVLAMATRRRGTKQSPETIAKRMATFKETGFLERLRVARFGTKQSPELVTKRMAAMIASGGRERSRLALLGRKQSAATIQKRTGHYAGRKLSESWCKNISKGKTGGKRPDVAKWAPEKFSMFNRDQVMAIRADRVSGLSYRKLAKKHQCNVSTAHLIVNGGGAFYSQI